MSVIVLAGLAMAAAHSHAVEFTHRDAPVRATYSAATSIETREIDAPANRGISRCAWSAKIRVDRAVSTLGGEPVAALGRSIASDRAISGIRSGTCAAARRGIDAELTRRGPELGDRLRSVAETDRAALTTELDSMSQIRAASAT